MESNKNQRKPSVRFLKNHYPSGKELNAHDGQLMNLLCLQTMVGGSLEKRNRLFKLVLAKKVLGKWDQVIGNVLDIEALNKWYPKVNITHKSIIK